MLLPWGLDVLDLALAFHGRVCLALFHHAPPSPPRSFPMPFSQEIMDSVVPANMVAVKASFTGVEDPKAHLTAFHT